MPTNPSPNKQKHTIQTYLVGGAVRDKLLGRPVSECDYVVVGATSDDLTSAGFVQVGADFPVFLHPITHDEYALARTERKTGKGYKGFECFADPSVTLEDDLYRRDLTINAMAIEVVGLFDHRFAGGDFTQNNIIDPYGGLDDLANKRLRHVSEAFCEDPVRVLRLARFYARYAPLGFDVADETCALVAKMRDDGELNFLVAERIWGETIKALNEYQADCYFECLDNWGVLSVIMPKLGSAIAYAKQNNHWQIIAQSLRLAHQHKHGVLFKFGLLSLCFLATHNLTTHNNQAKPACPTATDPDLSSYRQFCQALKAPKSYQHFGGNLLTHYHALMQIDHLDSNGLFKLIKQTAFLKSPDNLRHLLDCISFYQLAQRQIKLNAIYQTLVPISHKHIDQSLTGKDIGVAIDQLRLATLDALLS